MSHDITSRDNFGEVRAGGKRAWHGLGIEIPDGLTAVEGFPRVGLDWEEELTPAYCVINGRQVPTGQMTHFRKDTGEILGNVGEDYKPIPNMDLARFADMLLGEDRAMVLETAGSLLGGRRVFAFLRLPGGFSVVDGDPQHLYLAVTNGHGGFASCNGYTTAVRGVCANTIAMSERDLRSGFRFFHTGDVTKKMAQARLILGTAQKEVRQYETQVRALASLQLNTADLEHFLDVSFRIVFGEIPEEDAATREKLLARRKALRETWLANLANERNAIRGIEGTAWAAYNAVSEWHDHQRGRFKSVRESDARVHNNLFGEASKAKMKTFRAALSLA